MNKAMKVIIAAACVCSAIGLLAFKAYDMIVAKIRKIKRETWSEAWDPAFKCGYNAGRGAVLDKAIVNKYITDDEYDKIVEMTN